MTRDLRGRAVGVLGAALLTSILASSGEAGATSVIWPVDVHGAVTIRGGFGDMRGVGYHYGVDIAVDDAHPAAGAPAGMSQPVHAIRAGYAAYMSLPGRCIQRRIRVGSILYLHVSPSVPIGQRVAVGDPIGWTCRGNWHVHISQAAHVHVHDGEWVNPLGPGGVFAGYRDRIAPVVGPIVFARPGTANVLAAPIQPLRATARYAGPTAKVGSEGVSGVIDVIARMSDAWPAGTLGQRLPWLRTRSLPYRARVEIRDAEGRVRYRNTPFVADLLGGASGVHLPAAPGALFASGTHGPTAGGLCRLITRRAGRCSDGVYWIHMTTRDGGIGFDTSRLPNGRYTVSVEAWNVSGVHAIVRRRLIVGNGVSAVLGTVVWPVSGTVGPPSPRLPSVASDVGDG